MTNPEPAFKEVSNILKMQFDLSYYAGIDFNSTELMSMYELKTLHELLVERKTKEQTKNNP